MPFIFYRVCDLHCRVFFPECLDSSFAFMLSAFQCNVKQTQYELFVDLDAKCHMSGSFSKPAHLSFWDGRTCRVKIFSESKQSAANAIGTFLTRSLANEHGVLVHACMLIINNNAYVFVGPSGAGKSTIAKNAKDAIVVSDDICAIRYHKKQWVAHGTPMLQSGEKPSLSLSAPLAGLFYLKRHSKNYRRPVGATGAFTQLLRDTFIPFEDAKARTKVFQTELDMVAAMKPRELLFRKDLDVSSFLDA